MKKGTLFLLFSLVLFGVGVALVGSWQDRTESNVLSTLGHEPAKATILVYLETPENTYEIVLPKGSSVYDLLLYAQEVTDFRFAGRDFAGLGFFVEEINGKRQNPQEHKYWIYYINGQKAQMGVSLYEPNRHDIISWKYESGTKSH